MRVSRGRLRIAVLLLALVVTGIGIVTSRHESRRLFVDLQQLEQTRDELNVTWGRLQLEQATQAGAGRIERIARSELGLTPIKESVLLEVGSD